MQRLFLLLSVCLIALVGCGKSTPVPAPEPTPMPTPEATPAPTPEPTPEPINLNAQVLALCYHRFEENPKNSLAISPADFEAQMQALKDAGIAVIPMKDFLAWRRGEKSIPAQSAIVTIDDGYLSGYEVAWPILQKFDYPFTMFIYTDYVKGGARSGGQSMTWGQLGQMRDAGVDIQSHTQSHSALNARKGRSEEEYREWLQTELAGSKQILEDNLGIKVSVLAYPYGLHNETVREVAEASGYDVAMTVYGQPVPHNAEAMLVGRYAIESTKPKVFDAAVEALQKKAGQGMPGAGTAMPASATMVTQPMDGETITNPSPEIKVNLATLGDVDPASVVMRLSGVGKVPAVYDPKTKLLSYQTTQKFYARQVTVIVSAKADGRKVETRWSFNVGPAAADTPGT